jgi:hypothetical protein
MKGLTVLILSSDALAAALLGAAIEIAGFAPAFPRIGEAPRDALRRTRPCLVVVDCDLEDACGEAFFGPVIMTGARIAVFSSTRSRRVLDPIAAEFGVRAFTLPIDYDTLAQLLRECTPP